MTQKIQPTATLLVVDVQKGLDETESWGARNNPKFESNLSRLLGHWRANGRSIVHVKHNSVNPQSPLRPELPGNDFKEEARPKQGEPVYEKNVNSAFIGTTLEQDLRSANVEQLIVVGLTTNHCISTTVRMASNLGFDTFVVADATANFGVTSQQGRRFSAEQVHELSLANLGEEFATVVETDDLLSV